MQLVSECMPSIPNWACLHEQEDQTHHPPVTVRFEKGKEKPGKSAPFITGFTTMAKVGAHFAKQGHDHQNSRRIPVLFLKESKNQSGVLCD